MKMIKGFLFFNFLDGKKWKGVWYIVEMKINWLRIKIDLKEVKFIIIIYKCIYFVWIWLYILIIFFFLFWVFCYLIDWKVWFIVLFINKSWKCRNFWVIKYLYVIYILLKMLIFRLFFYIYNVTCIKL